MLIDFKQRGGWFAWSPPEIYYLEYVKYLATSNVFPEELAAQYGALLRKCEPEWKPPNESASYQNRAQGHSTAWVSLKPEEREAAQIFMLGKLLWCIFEGRNSINCSLGMELPRE